MQESPCFSRGENVNKDEKLRNRVLTLMRSHRRIVTAPEKENRNIREIASAQILGQE